MEYLIPMTDFVLEQEVQLRKNIHENYNNLLIPRCYDAIFNYANFLKKPLKLGFFIPCDENDVPLSEYYIASVDDKKNMTFAQLSNEYQEAKQRVLFEGFEINFEDCLIIPFLGKYPIGFFSIDNKWILSEQFKNIEDLLPFNLKLTETAKKEIGTK